MYEENVRRGIAVLDAYSQHREAWVFHVDLDLLDVADWRHCIVGQLTGEFHNGVGSLCDAYESVTGERPSLTKFAIEHGFELHPDVGETLSLDEYRQLTNTWRTHVRTLQFDRRALLDD